MKICATQTLLFLFRHTSKNKSETELELSSPPLPPLPKSSIFKSQEFSLEPPPLPLYDIESTITIGSPIQDLEPPIPAKKPFFFKRWKEKRKEKKAKKEEESKIKDAIELAKKPISQSAVAKGNSNIAEIQKKLIGARSALLDLKVDEAKKIYQEINHAYASLNAKDKAEVYRDIAELYNDRKIAEKFAHSRK